MSPCVLRSVAVHGLTLRGACAHADMRCTVQHACWAVLWSMWWAVGCGMCAGCGVACTSSSAGGAGGRECWDGGGDRGLSTAQGKTWKRSADMVADGWWRRWHLRCVHSGDGGGDASGARQSGWAVQGGTWRTTFRWMVLPRSWLAEMNAITQSTTCMEYLHHVSSTKGG